MRVDDDTQHPQHLLPRAVRGELDVQERARLALHLEACPDCATELEAMRALSSAMAPGEHDEALDRVAIEGALARLERPRTMKDRLGDWLRTRPWLRMPSARLAGGLAVAGALGVVLTLAVQPSRQPALPAAGLATAARTLILADGSEVVPIGDRSAVELALQTPGHTVVRLRAGAANFRVRHDSGRRFRVETGTVTIEDLGTVFRVEHQPLGKVAVEVSEGRVAVLSTTTGSRIELGPGEQRVFGPDQMPPEPREALTAVPKVEEAATPAGGARSGPRTKTPDQPAALLLAADEARRARNPQAAVAPLRRLVERFPKDPRAASAAFTLGWILMTDLARPREAALAFADAERIAPRGTLAEDAAARVVEAWQQAGDERLAGQAAQRYMRLYPNGRYTKLLRAESSRP